MELSTWLKYLLLPAIIVSLISNSLDRVGDSREKNRKRFRTITLQKSFETRDPGLDASSLLGVIFSCTLVPGVAHGITLMHKTVVSTLPKFVQTQMPE